VTSTALIVHAALAGVVLVCYTVLEALGHDATPLLGVLGGQALGVAGDRLAAKVPA
jgi:hypothetical protein